MKKQKTKYSILSHYQHGEFFPTYLIADFILFPTFGFNFKFIFMKKSFSIFIFLFAWMSLNWVSCNLPKGEEDTPSATLDSIQVEKVYHLLDNPEYPNCNLVVDFIYPTDCKNKEVLPIVQKQFIASYFGEKYEQYTPQVAVEQYTKDYLTNYKDLEEIFQKDLKENDQPGAWYSYYEMSSNTILYNKNDFLSYCVNFENYTGGAHGSHSFTNFTLDMTNGKRITEDDLFVEDYQDALAEILVNEIAKQNKLTDTKDLENIGYFSIDEIYPNNNFYIDDNGITYTFNEYEIAAYALGTTTVHLNFDQVKMLLKEDNPLVGRIKY